MGFEVLGHLQMVISETLAFFSLQTPLIEGKQQVHLCLF